ncbi:hypothetical protein COCNU_06G017550 [Cocos nucifera]|uniref:Uncharacterized protein n=1 Tax=Cocos nucifera TaxID=13894 RepID=A0A8K0IE87_COCNU|nr:hypothetical protein COCNU_06G017550 [Cocos nucifera]
MRKQEEKSGNIGEIFYLLELRRRRIGKSVGFGISLEERNRMGVKELTGQKKNSATKKTLRERVKIQGWMAVSFYRITWHGMGIVERMMDNDASFLEPKR